MGNNNCADKTSDDYYEKHIVCESDNCADLNINIRDFGSLDNKLNHDYKIIISQLGGEQNKKNYDDIDEITDTENIPDTSLSNPPPKIKYFDKIMEQKSDEKKLSDDILPTFKLDRDVKLKKKIREMSPLKLDTSNDEYNYDYDYIENINKDNKLKSYSEKITESSDPYSNQSRIESSEPYYTHPADSSNITDKIKLEVNNKQKYSDLSSLSIDDKNTLISSPSPYSRFNKSLLNDDNVDDDLMSSDILLPKYI